MERQALHGNGFWVKGKLVRGGKRAIVHVNDGDGALPVADGRAGWKAGGWAPLQRWREISRTRAVVVGKMAGAPLVKESWLLVVRVDEHRTWNRRL